MDYESRPGKDTKKSDVMLFSFTIKGPVSKVQVLAEPRIWSTRIGSGRLSQSETFRWVEDGRSQHHKMTGWGQEQEGRKSEEEGCL